MASSNSKRAAMGPLHEDPLWTGMGRDPGAPSLSAASQRSFFNVMVSNSLMTVAAVFASTLSAEDPMA